MEAKARAQGRMILSMEAVLPTPPSSSCDDDDEDVRARDETSAQEHTGPQASIALAHSNFKEMGIQEWYRHSPIYPTLQAALNDIGYVEHRTSPHKNCCLLFAYMVCTHELTPEQQWTK